eukprot:592487-Rhodomonas_salina.2
MSDNANATLFNQIFKPPGDVLDVDPDLLHCMGVFNGRVVVYTAGQDLMEEPMFTDVHHLAASVALLMHYALKACEMASFLCCRNIRVTPTNVMGTLGPFLSSLHDMQVSQRNHILVVAFEAVYPLLLREGTLIDLDTDPRHDPTMNQKAYALLCMLSLYTRDKLQQEVNDLSMAFEALPGLPFENVLNVQALIGLLCKVGTYHCMPAAVSLDGLE